MSDKKPVWVDEAAHAILKEYSKLTKESMVDIASRLVLDHLQDLDPASAGGAELMIGDGAPEPTEKRPRVAKARPARVENEGIRFLGGVWLV